MPEDEIGDSGTGPWVRSQDEQRDRDADQAEWERDPDRPRYIMPREWDEYPAGAVDEATGQVYSDADPGL